MNRSSAKAGRQLAPLLGGLGALLAVGVWPGAALARGGCPETTAVIASPGAIDGKAYEEALNSPPAVMVERALPYLYGPPGQRAEIAGVNLLCKAAKAGNADAMLRLVTVFALGQGVPMDKAEGERWLRAAAEAGQPRAMTTLGLAYAKGYYGPDHDADAVAWYRKGAEKDDEWAWLYLGDMYELGRGVPRDAALALEYRRRAVSLGDAAFRARLGAEGRSAPDWAKP